MSQNKLETVFYEVIAKYPASMYQVGEIIKVYKNSCRAYIVEIDEHSEKYDLRDFPAIFRLTDKVNNCY